MKQQNVFVAYILIGIGTFFLVKQLNLTLFENFYSWSTILMIIGISFLTYSFSTKQFEYIFIGILLLGFGIHFHGLENYSIWLDHWSVYSLIIGISFLGKFIYTKKGLLQAFIFSGIAILVIFSITLPTWFQWIYGVIDFLETFWPVALIAIGVYILKFKKQK